MDWHGWISWHSSNGTNDESSKQEMYGCVNLILLHDLLHESIVQKPAIIDHSAPENFNAYWIRFQHLYMLNYNTVIPVESGDILSI